MTDVDRSPRADDPELTVYIARDGAEIGECRRGDVEQLIREGELRPTDYYWYEGMEQWRELQHLPPPVDQLAQTQRLDVPEDSVREKVAPADEAPVEAEAAAAEPAADSSRRRWTIPPQARKPMMAAAIGAGSFLLAVLIAVLVVRLGHDSTPVHPRPAKAAPPVMDKEQDVKLRDKAAADLRSRLERLPARAEPPLYVFYYDVAVDMRRSGSARIPWEALVRGSENTIDPASEQTTKRTEFLLRTEYRDGQWTFKHYKGSTRNLAEPAETQEEHDDRTATPPALVTMLGLKIEPPDLDRR